MVVTSLGWFGYYLHQPIQLEYHLTDIKVKSAMEVKLSRPAQGSIRYKLAPQLDGKWRVKRNWLGVTAVTFYPTRPLAPGSSYSLAMEHVVPILATRPTIATKVIPVSVQKPGAVAAISPAPNAVDVAIDTTISVRLVSSNNDLRKLRMGGDAPLASAVPTSSDDKTFTWKLAHALEQGTVYHLTLTDQNQLGPDKQTLLVMSFTTVPEPHVVQATNQDHFYPGQVITVGFDQDMQATEAGLKFEMPGSGKWLSPQVYQFTPAGLAPGRAYGYMIATGTRAQNGGVTMADHRFQISTPGAVVVTGFSPSGSGVGVGAVISVSFDQPVNQASAQAAFSLTPATPGSFTWSGNTMTFHPSGLGYQVTYQVGLAAGVGSQYGLSSTRAFSHSFVTTYQVIKLNVPQYSQTYPMSCEESALRMALALYGIGTSDADVLGRVGYAPRPRDTASNTWDNPYEMFVGDIGGAQNTTGYGVFAPPIAQAARSYGRGATVANNVSADYIAQQIYAGHPVLAWGYSKGFAPDSWNVPGGGVVTTYKGEHVRVVYGVAGAPGNIIGFYLRDPAYGSLYWTSGQLMANMNVFGGVSNQTVTVY